MSSSTALLPKKKDVHPIFLRVCHSPWASIGQKALVGLRGLTAAYLTVSFIMVLDFDLKIQEHGWLTIFEFAYIASVLQLLYHIIAFSWTFMHLHYPHPGNQTETLTKRVQKVLSPPRQSSTMANRGWFSLFYTVANTFPILSTFIQWAILVPSHKSHFPVDDTFNRGWFTIFYVFNKYGITALISMIEILFFSSVTRQAPIIGHVFGIMSSTWFYLTWAYIGYIFTGKFDLWFLDYHQVGWEYSIASWLLSAVVANLAFAFTYSLHAIREFFNVKHEHKTSGYQQLPQ